jgi:regulator of replication initiation timing
VIILVDDNINELNAMVAGLKRRLEAAIEDGIIDRQENEDVMWRIKEIEMTILNDGIITKKERALMREAQEMLDSYYSRAEKKI